MRPLLPKKLGGEFWFSTFMIALGFAGLAFGLVLESGYKVFVGASIALIFGICLTKRVRDVRLAHKLDKNPAIAKIFYAQNN